MTDHEQITMQLRVAKKLTRWMNGKRHDPLPDWDELPIPVRKAYLEQAHDACVVIAEEYQIQKMAKRMAQELDVSVHEAALAVRHLMEKGLIKLKAEDDV